MAAPLFNIVQPSKFEQLGPLFQQNNLYVTNLLPHQVVALQDIAAYFQGQYRQETAVVVLPTGSGKTGIEVILPFYLADNGIRMKKVLIICPNPLLEQHGDTFSGIGGANRSFLIERSFINLAQADLLPSTSIVRDTQHLTNALVQFDQILANADKFHDRPNAVWQGPNGVPNNSFDIVIVDEAHHLPSATWQNIVTYFQSPATKIVFFTATPFRLDGAPITANLNITGYAHRLTKQAAITNNIIRSVRPHFETGTIQNPNPTTLTNNDAYMRILDKVNQLIQLKDLNEPLPGGKVHLAMLMAKNKAQAQIIENMANQNYQHLNSFCYHTDNDVSNSTLLKRFKGEITPTLQHPRPRLIVIVGKLQEGFDCDEVSIAALAKPMGRGGSKFTQFIGRAVRMARPIAGAQNADFVTHVLFHHNQNWQDYDNEHLIP